VVTALLISQVDMADKMKTKQKQKVQQDQSKGCILLADRGLEGSVCESRHFVVGRPPRLPCFSFGNRSAYPTIYNHRADGRFTTGKRKKGQS
jgi:hypothetical protein